MFDNTLNSSWDERSRRGLTTITSFGLQVLAVGVLLILPLLRPAGLPLFRSLSTPVSLGRPLEEPPAVRAHTASSSANAHPTTLDLTIRTPTSIPAQIATDGTVDAPPMGASGPYIPGATGGGSPDGVLSSLGTSAPPLVPVAPRTVAPPVRISHMSEGDLVRKVLPAYPPLARISRIEGQVLLQAVISKQGVIENLRLIAGHPMLVPAALDAVRQWRYRPYLLNNEPVEVETQITVNFSLGGK